MRPVGRHQIFREAPDLKAPGNAWILVVVIAHDDRGDPLYLGLESFADAANLPHREPPTGERPPEADEPIVAPHIAIGRLKGGPRKKYA